MTDLILITCLIVTAGLAINYYIKYRRCNRLRSKNAVRNIVRELNKTED